MINNKKVVVVLPAYNAAKTIEITFNEIDFNIVDDVILVDDRSKDDTVEVGKKLGIKHIVVHEQNKGYGGNQKTCYNKALEIGADIVIMLHPDYQYTPKLIPSMASLLGSGLYHVSWIPDFGKRGSERWNANDKIHFEPWIDAYSEHSDERQTFGIPHRLPRFYTRGA